MRIAAATMSASWTSSMPPTVFTRRRRRIRNKLAWASIGSSCSTRSTDGSRRTSRRVERRRARSAAHFRASYDAFGRRERRKAAGSSPSGPSGSILLRCWILRWRRCASLRSDGLSARQRRLWKRHRQSTGVPDEHLRRLSRRPRHLRAGDLVEIRSEHEILATLDEHGTLDGLPFMPEMLRFCGERVPCAESGAQDLRHDPLPGLRRLDEAVHLTELRCDGSSHGGCQASCLLFWKEEWLRPVETTSAQVDDPHAGR